MTSAIIVDDEDRAVRLLQDQLSAYCPEVEVVATANSVDTAYELIVLTKPKLLFLDIEMPVKNGFQLLSKFEEYPFKVIFTTAYIEYAIKAIRFSALDYLVKPIVVDDLKYAVSKAIKEDLQESRLKQLLINIGQKKLATISVKNGDQHIMIDVKTIVRFEADRNYTWVHLRNGKKMLVVRTLKYFEDLLEDNGFIRCHRSHLVNCEYIRELNIVKELNIVLKDKSVLPVSNRKKAVVRKWLS